MLIYNDGTYYHYFKNDTIELTCKGTWEKAKDVYCGIELDNFENYNELGSNYEEFGSYFLLKDGEYLNNGLDGNNEYSFIKSSETLTK
ncbi:hypothetical protein [Flavobacterium sp.]|uniref:hypothetical protein n=1 Tax=Flavobacterium sp. TaxID=239 RepID=UPI0025B9CA59|nr:hypothetical protein [Flavobacterium sp.]